MLIADVYELAGRSRQSSEAMEDRIRRLTRAGVTKAELDQARETLRKLLGML